MDNLTKEECTLYQEWQASDGNCCSTTGRPHAGYSKASPPVTICVDGKLKIACSLTDNPNIYYPTDGADMRPPTWAVKTMDQHIAGTCSAETVADLPVKITEEGVPNDCTKRKRWSLEFAKGLTLVAGKLEASINKLKGLVFNAAGQIETSINVLKGLVFNAAGQIEVNAGDGLTFDSTGKLKLNCQQLAYWVGHDNGNENVPDQYTYSFDQQFPTGPITPIAGGVRIVNPGNYRITYNVSAGSNGLGTGLTIINAHINGEDMSAITGVAGISWSLGDNPTGNTYDGDDYHTRGGIALLNAGDEVVLKTVDTFGFAGNKKASGTMTVEQLPSHQIVGCVPN